MEVFAEYPQQELPITSETLHKIVLPVINSRSENWTRVESHLKGVRLEYGVGVRGWGDKGGWGGGGQGGVGEEGGWGDKGGWGGGSGGGGTKGVGGGRGWGVGDKGEWGRGDKGVGDTKEGNN